MSILWYEGFENYGLGGFQTSGATEYGSTTLGGIVAENPRTGDKCLRYSNLLGNLRRVLDPVGGRGFTRVGYTMGLYMGGLPNFPGPSTIGQLRNNFAQTLLAFRVTPIGRVEVRRNGFDGLFGASRSSYVAETRTPMAAQTWNFIEIEATLSRTAGSVRILINGIEALNVSNIDTVGNISAGTSMCHEFAMGVFDTSTANQINGGWYVDDIVMFADTSDDGSDSNTSPGQCGVYYRPVNADGAYEEWSLTQGEDAFRLLDELEPDEDATYVFSDAVGERLSLDVQSLPANINEVLAVSTVARIRKTDSGGAQIRLGVVSGNNIHQGGVIPLTDNYQYFQQIYETNPEGDSAWSAANLPEVFIRRSL